MNIASNAASLGTWYFPSEAGIRGEGEINHIHYESDPSSYWSGTWKFEENLEGILQKMHKCRRQDHTYLSRHSNEPSATIMCPRYHIDNIPVPKCLRIKKRIEGIRSWARRRDRVGNAEAKQERPWRMTIIVSTALIKWRTYQTMKAKRLQRRRRVFGPSSSWWRTRGDRR